MNEYRFEILEWDEEESKNKISTKVMRERTITDAKEKFAEKYGRHKMYRLYTPDQ